MEERPRVPRNLPEEEIPPQQEAPPASPGEVFLKKWMGIAPERAETHHSSSYHDGSKFKGWFRETLFPKSETAAEQAELENLAQLEEAYFDKRHEAKDSQQQTITKEPAVNKTKPSVTSEAHHISEVIGDRAKDIEHVAASHQAGVVSGQKKTKVQSTLGQYVMPVGIGFLAAILILLVLIIGGR